MTEKGVTWSVSEGVAPTSKQRSVKGGKGGGAPPQALDLTFYFFLSRNFEVVFCGKNQNRARVWCGMRRVEDAQVDSGAGAEAIGL